MKWVLDMGTRQKLLLGFGLMVALIAMAVLTAYIGTNRLITTQRHIDRVVFANHGDLVSIRSNLNGVRASQLQMLLVRAGAERAQWLQDVEARSRMIDDAMTRLLERNAGNPVRLARLNELQAAGTEYSQTMTREVLPLIELGKNKKAHHLILGIQLERYQKLRDASAELSNEADKEIGAAIAASEQRAEKFLRALTTIGAVSVILALTMAITLGWIMAVPLNRIAETTGKIAGGDLTAPVPYTGRADEVGELAKAFAAMVENLRRTTREIREAANILASSASQILASMTQLSTSATETSTAVNETTTTVEEVKQTAQLSTQKSKDISSAAQEAAKILQAGREYVEGSSAGMRRIKEQMESIGESTVKLSEQSLSIGEITATVNDIAEQSNLLAVNASIEAAKAGEYGKGFGVVAQEIKSLSAQSKQATAQVRDILADIQKAISSAVMAAEQAGRAVDAGMTQTGQTSEAIGSAVEAASKVAQASTQIVASSSQQLIGTDQVAVAMENIKQASLQNMESMKQVEGAVSNLHELGQKLKKTVEQFRV